MRWWVDRRGNTDGWVYKVLPLCIFFSFLNYPVASQVLNDNWRWGFPSLCLVVLSDATTMFFPVVSVLFWRDEEGKTARHNENFFWLDEGLPSRCGLPFSRRNREGIVFSLVSVRVFDATGRVLYPPCCVRLRPTRFLFLLCVDGVQSRQRSGLYRKRRISKIICIYIGTI